MELFLTESREHLENLNNSLLRLEKDTGDKAALDEIFRSMHTIKGMAATMGFERMSTLSHKAEDLLDSVRKGKIAADDALVGLLFKSFDVLEGLLDRIESKGDDNVDVSSLIEELSGYEGYKPAAAHKKRSWVHVTLAEGCQFKAARAFVIFRSLEEIGDVIDSIPKAADIEDEAFDRDFKVLIETGEEVPRIRDLIQCITDVEKAEVLSADKAGVPAVEAVREKQHSSGLQSVRVNIERLDSIMNLVGELIINKARLEDISKSHQIPEFDEAVALNQQLMEELQYEVMQMRMVPIEQILNRFPRTVRDLSKEQGKEVNFVIEGGEIEVDRTILEEISEPLLHLIRNSIDHGIETPDERKKLGKPKVGLLKIKASREKGYIVIYIEDDGKGIDIDKVRETAVKNGVFEKAEANKMSDSEILDLIFMPAFSTAEKVSKVSGRGVGMDIVKSKIGAIGGSVSVDSEVGKGTKVLLKLPITLAIIQAMLVGLDKEIYAIPLSNINRIVNVKSKDIKSIKNQEVIRVSEEIIPLVKLPGVDMERSTLSVVIVEHGMKKAGLVVDSLMTQREIVIKALDTILDTAALVD